MPDPHLPVFQEAAPRDQLALQRAIDNVTITSADKKQGSMLVNYDHSGSTKRLMDE